MLFPCLSIQIWQIIIKVYILSPRASCSVEIRCAQLVLVSGDFFELASRSGPHGNLRLFESQEVPLKAVFTMIDINSISIQIIK